MPYAKKRKGSAQRSFRFRKSSGGKARKSTTKRRSAPRAQTIRIELVHKTDAAPNSPLPVPASVIPAPKRKSPL